MSTKLIRSLSAITPREQGGILTIGNFDGVHLGHQQLLNRVLQFASEKSLPSLALTFEPHPALYFRGRGQALPRLTGIREKFQLISDQCIDNLLLIDFNQQIASLSASDFVIKILARQLHPAVIVIGEDFRFGHLRMGDVALLQHLGERLGFIVSVVPPVEQDGLRVSSTLIRQGLAEGDLQAATRLLGHPYFICGRVAPGDQIGRQLGFPTANIYLDHRAVPIQGVFAVRVKGITGESLPGVASLGTRPTVHGTRKVLEVYLFDFNQAIYGRMICVQFCEKLRDEVYFENLDLLKEQIIKDVAIARAYHAKR